MPDGPGTPAPFAHGVRSAVVSPHYLASEAGIDILRRGGSAVDAAIAVNAVLAVVAPSSCGLGGDAFWLIWDESSGSLDALAGVGAAARRIDPDRLRASGLTRIPTRGPLPITVPGAVRSWRDAHARFGILPMPTLLEPAIRLATDGFPASPYFVRRVETTFEAIDGRPWAIGFEATFRPLGRAWVEEDIVRLPALAGTLRRLSDDGLDDLYEGRTAGLLAAALEAAGSDVRADDLADHRSRWGVPLIHAYRGVHVATHRLPSCGVVGILLLAILERFPPPGRASFGRDGWTDTSWFHFGIEAAKRALEARDALLGDPDVVNINEEAVLADRAVDALAARLNPGRAADDTPPLATLVGGTAYLATADAAGNAVSLIASNASGFGSGVVDPTSGITFHDRGQGFSLDPNHPNALAPGKRPLHSLLPAMLLRDGRPWILVGSMGGDAQPQILAQVASAIVDGGADIAAAVSAPRWAVIPREEASLPVPVLLERGFDTSIAEDLRSLGHAVRLGGPNDDVGHCHAIELHVDGWVPESGHGERLAATTDPRSEGRPAVD